MNKKSSIIISSIAACAIFASAFAFNGFAVGETKAISQQAQSSDIERIATTELADKLTQELSKDIENCPDTKTSPDVKKNTTTASAKKDAPANSAKKANTTNNQQTNIALKNKLESALKTANVNTETKNNLQSLINNIDCNETTAKNTNYSAINAKLESLLKSITGSSATKPVSGKPTPSMPAPSKPTPSEPSPSKPAPTNGEYSAFQKKVVELVNAERSKNGLKPLTMNTELSKVATVKSQDMAKNNYFDHNSPTYGSPFDMMKKFGISYKTAGENIAMGQTSPEQVMQGWMNSPGHRANILKASFTQIGVGVAKNSSGRLYWTQQFIG